MVITVRLYGTLRRFSNNGIWRGDIPAASTVKDLIHQIGASENEVAAVSINGQAGDFTREILPGDDIVLVTHIGGG